MSLKARVTEEELQKLSDVEKGHYTKVEGDGDIVHQLDVVAVGGYGLEDAAGIRAALQRERKTVETTRNALKAFEGIDSVKAQEALDKVDEMADWDPDKKMAEAKTQYEKQLTAKFEGQLRQVTDKHDKAVKDATARNETLQSQLSSTLVDAAATKAIVDAKGSVALLIHAVKAKVDRKVDESGKMTVVVTSDEGLVRLSPKPGSTDPMTIEELVAELKQSDEFARAFDGAGASGSGAGGSDGSGRGGETHTLSQIDARDPAKYRAAKERADKAGKDLAIAEQ